MVDSHIQPLGGAMKQKRRHRLKKLTFISFQSSTRVFAILIQHEVTRDFWSACNGDYMNSVVSGRAKNENSMSPIDFPLPNYIAVC
jgi:hypothetical protein